MLSARNVSTSTTRIERGETGVYICSRKKKGKNGWPKRRIVGSEKCNNKMRAAQKEALAIIRKTYGSIPGLQ